MTQSNPNPPPEPPSAPRQRDRAATELALRSAARAVLEREGFQAFGINAVAREAQCDKQLIYRYFGGLEGLLDAVGQDLSRDLEQRFAALSQDPPQTYRVFAERLVLGYLATLRVDPLLQKLLVWEIAAPSPALSRLTAARSRGLSAFVAVARGTLLPPAGCDAPALNALLLAAVQHLCLAATATGHFSGLDLSSDAAWSRIEAGLATLLDALYGPAGAQSTPSGHVNEV